MTREALSEGVNHEILGADPRRLADAMFRMFRSPSRFDFPFVRKRYPVLDPRYFDDPVAMRTGWAPMSPGGFRRTLHRLREIGPQVLSFQPTAYRHYQTFVYLGSLLAFGNVLIASLLRNELNINRHEHWWVIQLLAQILVGCCVTLFLLNRAIVIDGNTAEVRLGLPRLGWLNQLPWLRELVCHSVPFAEIHSIQLLDEEVRRTSESMFWSYELNLVLSNGKRINLIDHGNQREIRWDAGDLSRMIDVPIWDFIGYRQPAHALDPDEIKARILQHIF